MNASNTKTLKRHFARNVASPVGKLRLVGGDDGLAAILWEHDRAGRVRLNVIPGNERHPVLVEAERQLGEYFTGQRRDFDLRLDFIGTAFQKKVWHALRQIPFGETRTYGQIARQLGYPKSVRAVGAANGRNPISIMTPCHRVIGANGHLTGFAGGLERKRYLLDLERGEVGPATLPLDFSPASQSSNERRPDLQARHTAPCARH